MGGLDGKREGVPTVESYPLESRLPHPGRSRLIWVSYDRDFELVQEESKVSSAPNGLTGVVEKGATHTTHTF